jgi:hypothetical protein
MDKTGKRNTSTYIMGKIVPIKLLVFRFWRDRIYAGQEPAERIFSPDLEELLHRPSEKESGTYRVYTSAKLNGFFPWTGRNFFMACEQSNPEHTGCIPRQRNDHLE